MHLSLLVEWGLHGPRGSGIRPNRSVSVRLHGRARQERGQQGQTITRSRGKITKASDPRG